MPALDVLDGWPVDHASAAVVTGSPPRVVATHGDTSRVFAWASVTKVVTALATLVAVEEGTVALDEQLRRLLAHAPGDRRQYSNESYERIAARVADDAGMPFADYAREAVLRPLGMTGTDVTGSPAAGASGPVADLAALARELLDPTTIVSGETLRDATTVQFPGLAGVLPGYGRQDPNDWGLGFELRDHKSPHWTGSRNSPRTFGHFGRTGTFVWVDPDAGVALACLTDRDFGDWAVDAWPAVSDAVLAEFDSRG